MATNLEADVELELAENQYWVDMHEALARLEANPDYQKVILEGYMRDKTLGAAAQLADPATKQRGQRPDLMEELVAVSNYGYYCKMVHQLGSIAKSDMDDGETN